MITASVYMQIPLFLQRYINSECTIQKGLGVAVSMFGIGLFAIGPFTNLPRRRSATPKLSEK